MALEFTNIPDRNGAAVYVIGDGTTRTEEQLIELGTKVDKLTEDSTQVVYLDPKNGDGVRLKEFYSLQYFPCVLIVMDDDTIARQWDVTIPKPEEVSYALNQINGSMRTS